ncbi:hypothetical protein [Actinosynnema sp. NPDC023587]|uniref:hypothetical protein n=1 Tax=Actinosynnema sp. NPDC023587 TaxID=3154695 RepID=UPI0033EAA918
MVDFHVVPEAMRRNAKEFVDVADAWNNARSALLDAHLADDDLGLLGRTERVPQSHNAGLNNILDRLAKGFEALNNAALALRAVADEYESRDAEYYRQFGYLDDRPGR